MCHWKLNINNNMKFKMLGLNTCTDKLLQQHYFKLTILFFKKLNLTYLKVKLSMFLKFKRCLISVFTIQTQFVKKLFSVLKQSLFVNQLGSFPLCDQFYVSVFD